jgi:putative glycosyltransferase (TIGR04348 family)
MSGSSVVIVSPAGADANNGNWRTAARWADLLAPTHRVRIAARWPDGPQAAADTVMLALHARRSAESIANWAEAHPRRALVVVMTGTDLYQDIASDASAQRSLELAQRLVVLQELGVQALPPQHRDKARVVFQSAPQRAAVDKPADLLRAIMVGHLRAVKSPQTLFEAAQLLRDRDEIRIDHVGEATEPALGEQARATAAACPHYRWLGALPHEETLARIQQAHLLVHPSALEGGAHVIIEAVRSGTPVLASRVPGNVGMLGADYAGYFAHGDAGALASLLQDCRATQRSADGLMARLQAQCAARCALFDVATERTALLRLLAELEASSAAA